MSKLAGQSCYGRRTWLTCRACFIVSGEPNIVAESIEVNPPTETAAAELTNVAVATGSLHQRIRFIRSEDVLSMSAQVSRANLPFPRLAVR